MKLPMERREWIDLANAIDWESFTFEAVEAHGHGDDAVVEAHISQTGTYQGQDVGSRWMVLDLLTRRGGRWVIIARHAVPQPPSP